ncbi:MAG TPA: zinc metallopeptidase [Candidatus Pseudogracilibacillus intestinigallinarum]|uniref:Zinc metallopeptidase n=1 Tax=Candidatus Pseudogracilibacillus intestinigallinarum TaxID=2838742 RepID=A0A9D1PPI6_9BACI|nr:zinc metallopeptidase [Candidatus Pseudogracilibacillus intestinigallinarum]
MSLGAYIIYFILLMIIPLWAQSKVKTTYSKYSKVVTSSSLTGAQVARKILDENGLFDVHIEEVKGTLTDHYDPRSKVVRLSTGNYHGHSMAAAAVAAHEVGHAIQDAESYAFLNFRTALVPLASFGSNSAFIIIFAGIILNSMNLILLGIIFMSFAVLFQLITLPVEFNASSRAMDQLVMTGIITNSEERETKKVLNAAALTYVAAALVAVAELLRFILMFLANRD